MLFWQMDGYFSNAISLKDFHGKALKLQTADCVKECKIVLFMKFYF